uniref:Uncharacterized protein n=1 Tax=Hemiselmis tepida TaxID=464990 RepID=A0A7S0V7R0_9CRYP
MMEEGSSGNGADRGAKYRRTAAVLSVLCLTMLLCTKLASHHTAAGGVTGLATAMQSTASALSQAAAGGHGSAEASGSDKEAEAAKSSMFAQKAGWDKGSWSAGDWAAWVIPGPLMTIVATGFVFGLYGPLWASGVLVVLVGVDVFSYYVGL